MWPLCSFPYPLYSRETHSLHPPVVILLGSERQTYIVRMSTDRGRGEVWSESLGSWWKQSAPWLMSLVHQGFSFRVSHKPVPRPRPNPGVCRADVQTELSCAPSLRWKGWGVFVCLTIQTFSMVLFLSIAIMKLVSDGLVQFPTLRLGFCRQEMWSVAHMNASLVP